MAQESPAVIPMISYENGLAAVQWLSDAFGFRERAAARVVGPDGRLQHAELQAGDGLLMLASPTADYVMVHVDDVDRHYARAKAAGATILSELEDGGPGRRYRAEDLEGHRWMFLQRREAASAPPATAPPQATVMQMVMAAWTSQTISTVTRLSVPDLVSTHGPLTARQLVETHHVDARPDLLERALRACASVGVFTESADGRFGPTPLSEVLVAGAPGSVRQFVELIGGRWWGPFAALTDVLRAGQPQGSTPAESQEGTAENFAGAMKSQVESTRGVAEHADLARARVLVDVGGSIGHVAIALLERHAHLRACVLDLPAVVTVAERLAAREAEGVRSRLSFVVGDMFADVPPADTYLVKKIMHDWDDAQCVRILRNCRGRLAAGGRILGVDNVVPPMGDTGASSTKLLDMLMMVLLPGKERTEAEWRALYAAAGLRVTSITPINPRSVECIIEGVPG